MDALRDPWFYLTYVNMLRDHPISVENGKEKNILMVPPQTSTPPKTRFVHSVHLTRLVGFPSF